MNTSQVAIVAGGNLDKAFLSDIRSADFIIGVDRGAYWLVAHGVIPNVAIGDFDSVNKKELRLINEKIKRVEVHPKEKDFTDMDLAVEHAITLHPKKLVIYGAIGSRLDHTIGNIHLLEKLFEAGIEGIIQDHNNEVRIVKGNTIVNKEDRYPYISLVPVTETIEVTLTGFLYDVSHARVRRGQTLGISNEIRVEKATVEVHQGKALVIRSRD